MLGFNMLSHQVCEIWRLFESAVQLGLEEIYSFGHLFSFLKLLVCAAPVLVAPSRLPGLSLAAICHNMTSVVQYYILHSYYVRIATLSVQAPLPSLCTHKTPLFSATQRQKEFIKQKIPPLSYSQCLGSASLARGILGSNCPSAPTDKFCSLWDVIFVMLYPCAWGGDDSPQQLIDKILSKEQRAGSDPVCSMKARDFHLIKSRMIFPCTISTESWVECIFSPILVKPLSSKWEEFLEAESLLGRNNPSLQAWGLEIF